ncbi:MAG: Maf family protein [Thermoguttaceae bacterium]
MSINRLVLASASPRRRELLQQADYCFDIVIPDDSAEDEPRLGESPVELVARLARQKAENVAAKINGMNQQVKHGRREMDEKTGHQTNFSPESRVILACDTVVYCQNQILGKPVDRDDAREMLRLLRGTRHSVFSGLHLLFWPENRAIAQTAETVLDMCELSDEMLEQYLESGKWSGKAGSFGYQDGNDWLRIVSGSESNVVGLPLELLELVYPAHS